MADKKIPFGTYLFGAMGAAALVRGLWNAHRAVVRKGQIAVCAGAECSPLMALRSGDSRVYAAGGGRVALVDGGVVHVRVSNEPVVLHYEGLAPTVRQGQYVLRGQPLGDSTGVVHFGVWLVRPDGSLTPLEPAAWLASRGYRAAVSVTGQGGTWCEQGRRIEIPAAVHSGCGIKAGSEPSFALLPVSVREA